MPENVVVPGAPSEAALPPAARADRAGEMAASAVATPDDPKQASTAGLIAELVSQSVALAKKELALARTELREDLRGEVAGAVRLGMAAVAGLLTVNILLVTAVFALARTMPNWAAGLLASGVTLLFAVALALSGWRRVTHRPLERTRRTLKEGAPWTDEKLA